MKLKVAVVGFAFYLIPITSGADGNICALQAKLKELKRYNGNITCQLGPKTLEAIKQFQIDNGLPGTGWIGERTVKALFDKDKRIAVQLPQRKLTYQEEFAYCNDEVVEVINNRLDLNEAISLWERVAMTKYGEAFGDWNKALDRRHSCLRLNGEYNCLTIARACKQ